MRKYLWILLLALCIGSLSIPSVRWQLIRFGYHLMEFWGDGHVKFYARIVDQNGHGVEGVVATFELTAYNAKSFFSSARKEGSGVRSETFTVISDTDGWVKITGKRGNHLRLWGVEAQNCIVFSNDDPMLYPEHSSFGYGKNLYEGEVCYTDPKNPLHIPVWRRHGGEALLRFDRRVRFEEFEEVTGLNLFTASKTDNDTNRVDIIISRVALEPPDTNAPYAFRMIFRVPHGGLIETEDFFPYRASKSGYQSSLEYLIDPDSLEERNSRWKKRFYLKLRGGASYASVMVRRDSSGMQIHAWVNPSDSTNLEPDDSKFITDTEEKNRLDQLTFRRFEWLTGGAGKSW